MAKTLISRLDAENIVRAAVDPDTHEATGDVYDSVNDVSYPFGGGSGAEIHTLTAVITNGETTYPIAHFMVAPSYNDGVLENDEDLAAGQTVTKKYLYTLENDEYLVIVAGRAGEPLEVSTSSDNVNCNATLLDDGITWAIKIVDPDLDASINVTLVLSGGIS